MTRRVTSFKKNTDIKQTTLSYKIQTIYVCFFIVPSGIYMNEVKWYEKLLEPKIWIVFKKWLKIALPLGQKQANNVHWKVENS